SSDLLQDLLRIALPAAALLERALQAKAPRLPRGSALLGAYQIQCRMDRGRVKQALRAQARRTRGSREDHLGYVLGLGRIPRNAVGNRDDAGIFVQKKALEPVVPIDQRRGSHHTLWTPPGAVL